MKRTPMPPRKSELRTKPKHPCGALLPLLLPSDTDDPTRVCSCGSSEREWGTPRPALRRSGPILPKPRAARVGAATGQPKPLNDFSPATRKLVRERSGGLCEACGDEPAVLHHHRRPRRRDGWRPGTNEASNALHLGVDCNERIEVDDRLGALELGQLLHADQDPAAEPVLRRGEWVLLTDDGRYEPTSHEEVA